MLDFQDVNSLVLKPTLYILRTLTVDKKPAYYLNSFQTSLLTIVHKLKIE